MVISLASIHSGLCAQVGGKAANLGEMIRAGFPVPPGVCVTTEAYATVAQNVCIDFSALGTAQSHQLRKRAAETREALLAVPTPPALERAIVESYQRLAGGGPVAVRSSATAEDLPNASFAGQQDTYLNVTGPEDVLRAVRQCWASLWTERAVVYRNTNGIDHRTVRIAVVIQRMVDSTVAGVMFTANPVTGRRGETVIDASPGLGEAVVSGAVNPDRFEIECDSARIRKRLATAGGQPCLSDGQLRELAALGRRVESLYGAPQDTEFALDATGKIWLTQARPITTLYPLPESSLVDGLRVYFCFSLAQGLVRPLTPMGLSCARVMASAVARLFSMPVDDPLAGPHTFVEAGQRAYIDVTNLVRGRVGRSLMPRVLDVMESRSAAVLRKLAKDERFSLTTHTPWLFLKRAVRIALLHRVPQQLIEALIRPRAARERLRLVGKRIANRRAVPPSSSTQERLDFAERILLNEIVRLGPTMLPPAALGLGMMAVARKLLGSKASAVELETVLRGLPHNVTTDMDLALWDAAVRIGADETARTVIAGEPPSELARRYRARSLPAVAQSAVDEFLSQYGHRAVAEIDVGLPRWSDDPTHILGVLANYLRLDDAESAPRAQFTKGAEAAEAMIHTLVQRAGGFRGRLLRLALCRARDLAGLRELPKYQMVVALAAVRRELTKVGEELVRRGEIAEKDDIFFLTLGEAREALAGRNCKPVICERRQRYETELRRRHVPRVFLSDGTEPEAVADGDGHRQGLAGTPASAGIVTGIARVISDPVGARIEPGEILVAPSTDPGWTPLFLTAAGLVMEMGGANSHGAVVAREYGIPAVVGVPSATALIQSGIRITVDGSSGLVRTL
ncbi:MAG: PEP/pyruvate-binding domain-containing protein [Bryobacteraceae bacterium]|nr:PEP/pyruvate-binding domain-containing protein [Bryobacteraceae bacterium]